jgi:hypothetical protein
MIDQEIAQMVYREDLMMMEGARARLVAGRWLVTPHGRADCCIDLEQVGLAKLHGHIALRPRQRGESEIVLTPEGAKMAYGL